MASEEQMRKRNLEILRKVKSLKKRVMAGGRFPREFPYSLHKTRKAKMYELNKKIQSIESWFRQEARYMRKVGRDDKPYLI